MIQTPAIVTFANKKGGVGKTTLCVTFANYLYTMGVRVVVIDCDLQHSISKCRKAEIRKYGDAQIPYQVEMFDINDRKGMNALIDKVRNDPSIDVVLFDVPEMVKADGLVPLLANSDVKILLDQTKFKDRYNDIAAILGLTAIQRQQIFTVNALDNHEGRNYFKEVWICRGQQSDVYGVDEPSEFFDYS